MEWEQRERIGVRQELVDNRYLPFADVGDIDKSWYNGVSGGLAAQASRCRGWHM